MSKNNNWQTEIDQLIRTAQKEAFVAGTADCLCFVRDAVEISSGIDIMDGHKGKYDNLREGYSIIKKLRGSMAGVLDKYFNRIGVNYAQRGDAVLVKFEDDIGWAFGIVSLDGKSIVFKSQEGLRVVSRKIIKDLEQIYWRIECLQ